MKTLTLKEKQRLFSDSFITAWDITNNCEYIVNDIDLSKGWEHDSIVAEGLDKCATRLQVVTLASVYFSIVMTFDSFEEEDYE